jgi:hypothetical protein
MKRREEKRREEKRREEKRREEKSREEKERKGLGNKEKINLPNSVCKFICKSKGIINSNLLETIARR